MRQFRFLKTATADIAFDAYGKTKEELCEHAALALESVMVDLSTIRSKKMMCVKVCGNDLGMLVFNLLDELVYLKDVKQILFCKCKISIQQGTKKLKLTAKLWGEKINPKTQQLGNDIKAVTYHLFEVKKSKIGYKVRVLVDV
ncbi:MAG: archease [Nanoarchaeota archaeon]